MSLIKKFVGSLKRKTGLLPGDSRRDSHLSVTSIIGDHRVYTMRTGTRNQRRKALHVAHQFPPGSIVSPTRGSYQGSYCRVERISLANSRNVVLVIMREPIGGQSLSMPSTQIKLRYKGGAKLKLKVCFLGSSPS